MILTLLFIPINMENQTPPESDIKSIWVQKYHPLFNPDGPFIEWHGMTFCEVPIKPDPCPPEYIGTAFQGLFEVPIKIAKGYKWGKGEASINLLENNKNHTAMEFPNFKKFNLAELRENEAAFQILQQERSLYKLKATRLEIEKEFVLQLLEKERSEVVSGLLKISELESRMAERRQAYADLARTNAGLKERNADLERQVKELQQPLATKEMRRTLKSYLFDWAITKGRVQVSSDWTKTPHFKEHGQEFYDVFDCYVVSENPTDVRFVKSGGRFHVDGGWTVDNLKEMYLFDFWASKEAASLK